MNRFLVLGLIAIACFSRGESLYTTDFSSDVVTKGELSSFLADNIEEIVAQAVMRLPIFEGLDSESAYVKTVGGAAYGLKVADSVTHTFVSSNITLRYIVPEDPAGVYDQGSFSQYAAYCPFNAYIKIDGRSFVNFVDSTTNSIAGAVVPVSLMMFESENSEKSYTVEGSLRSWVLSQNRTIKTHNPTNTSYGTTTWSSGSIVWGFCDKNNTTLMNMSTTGIRNSKNSSGYGFYFVIVPTYSLEEQDDLSYKTVYTGEQTWTNIIKRLPYSDTESGLVLYVAKNSTSAWDSPDSNLSTHTNYRGGATEHTDSKIRGSEETVETISPSGKKVPVLTETNITNTPIGSIVLSDGLDKYRVSVSNGQLRVDYIDQ